MSRRRSSLRAIALVLIALLGGGVYVATQPPSEVRNVSALIDPAKLTTLRTERGANDRLLKAIYWLETADAPEEVVKQSVSRTYSNVAQAKLVERSLVRNLKIAKELGCLTTENLERMRRGESPVITRGPYAGENAEVDHIIPVAAAPEWSNSIANLELLPKTLNRRKGATMGQRQTSLRQEFTAAGM